LMLPFIVDLNYKIDYKKRDIIENKTLIQNWLCTIIWMNQTCLKI
jgi:hypothetical protein